jgi:uncharacterized protein
MFAIPKLLLVLLLAGTASYADSLPTIHQVYQTAQAGHLDDAQHMVDQVLKAHPESAKAHFVNAEILVRQGNMANAKSELALAEKLSPGLPFAKPESVENIKQRISEKGSTESMNTASTQSGQSIDKTFPWMMLVIGIGAVLLIWMVLRSVFSRRAETYPSQNNGGYSSTAGRGYPIGSGNPAGFGGGQPYPAQTGGGIGSGIASGLATGAAAGVGIVAGEALMHHFMDGSTNETMNNAPYGNNNNQLSNTIDDPDFGVSDSSSWDNDSTSDSFGDSGDDTW